MAKVKDLNFKERAETISRYDSLLATVLSLKLGHCEIVKITPRTEEESKAARNRLRAIFRYHGIIEMLSRGGKRLRIRTLKNYDLAICCLKAVKKK